MKLLVAALLLAAVLSAVAERMSYDGFKVYNVVPRDVEALGLLKKMLVEDVNVDFWKEPSRVGHRVTFMVSPLHQQRVVTSLRRAGIDFTVHRDNVQDVMTPMWEEIDRRRAAPGPHAFDLNNFNTLTDIYAWLNELVGQCRAGFTCELLTIGTTSEARAIHAFRIYQGTGRTHYYLEANTHAREWITSSTLLNIMDDFVRGVSAEGIRLVDSYDWTFVPVVNPDGYSFTWTDQRLWRKNRRDNVNAACMGVDINRNYDWSWGEEGAAHQECGETYCGPSAASELETQAISNYLLSVAATTPAMLTLHSYGNMFMFPWGTTVNNAGDVCERTEDHDELMRVADAAANAIENTYNTVWGRGNSCEVIYATSGGTNDYAKGGAGIKYAFVAELRGEDFVIAPSQIALSYKEVLNGIVAMVDSIGA
jgi:carboxypeptidase A2